MSLKLRLYDTIPLMVYLLLATGKVLPLYAFGVLFPFHTAIIILYLLTLLTRPGFGHSLRFAGFLLFPLLAIYLIASIRSADPNLIAKRLEGAFLLTILIATLVSVYAIKYSETYFQQAFLKVAILILFLTILYKIGTGFFDRGERFFLNGPIVFGWIMGFAALTSLYQAVNRQGRPLVRISIAFIFLTSVIWTSSKGPIFALAIAAGFIFLINVKNSRVYLYLGLTFVALILLVPYLPDKMTVRFLAFTQVLGSSVYQGDFGSVGIRPTLWKDAINMFLENPFFGVGAGNWQFGTQYGEYVYPHSMTLELAAETGVFGLTAFFAMVGFIFFKSSNWMRVTLIYFLICTSFSGDFYYFRMVVALPIAFLAARNFRHYSRNVERNR